MVEHTVATTALDQTFHALADRTRRAMLAELASGPRSVSDLAAPHDMSLAAASKHVKVLERAGLLRREVRGRTHHCHLEAAPLHQGMEWIRRMEAFWSERLDALEEALKLDQEPRNAQTQSSPSSRRQQRRGLPKEKS